MVDAPEWTNLFKRLGPWFGGDGIFAIPQSAKDDDREAKNLILFSDTMVGDIQDSVLQEGFHMVNNSLALLQGKEPKEDAIEFLIAQDASGKNKAVFVPNLPNPEEGEYFWLGDGFVNPATGKTHIFAYRVKDYLDREGFTFEIHGGALITLPKGSKFPHEDQEQVEVPFFFPWSDTGFGSFGAGVYVNTESANAPHPDGYIYIYGVNDPGKQMLVARVTPKSFEDFSSWRFWDGSGWNPDFRNSASVADSVSNELSVSPLPNGKWLAVFQINTIEPYIGISFGESPFGPFGPVLNVWDCHEALERPEFFAYNAKAHPSLSQPGELLISYNVNSTDFWNQVEDHPQLYRPRFLKINFE